MTTPSERAESEAQHRAPKAVASDPLLPCSDIGVVSELHDVFHVRQVTRGTALEQVVGVDLVHMEAGQQSQMHRHNRAQTVLFITAGVGELLLTAAMDVVPLSPGARIAIPPATFHAVRTGPGQSLDFLSVQSPPILDLSTGTLDLEPLPASGGR